MAATRRQGRKEPVLPVAGRRTERAGDQRAAVRAAPGQPRQVRAQRRRLRALLPPPQPQRAPRLRHRRVRHRHRDQGHGGGLLSPRHLRQAGVRVVRHQLRSLSAARRRHSTRRSAKTFRKLLDNNWLSESTIQQLYCNSCHKFLADRLVEGSCPKEGCGYDSARGDQCEKCGKLLNSTELIETKCKVCRGTPCVRDTNNFFLELPLLKEKLEKYISEASGTGTWSQNAVHTTNAWLEEGLKPRCITRNLKWGVPVPHEKYKDKVLYVWFDAPIGYISITACYTPEWEKWWKNPENVELYQFMGKDNVPFHTVVFPSTLLGTGKSWTFMKTISVTEYLNYESG